MKLEIEMRKMDAILQKGLCESLVVNPKTLQLPNFDTEDDSWESLLKY